MTCKTTLTRRDALTAFGLALLCSTLTLGSTLELFVITGALA
ncbi:hypothetical protein [Croceibacterium salegens]|nr:hypothetical protein [Croceibacterium salegens]